MINNIFPLLSFDILPMSSPLTPNNAKYAVSIIFSKNETIEKGKVSRHKLISLIKKYKPIYIGTDNPNEIISPAESLSDFCEIIPSQSSIVHVNLSNNGRSIPLISILKLHNIANHKLTPLNTARALNQLMMNGVGMKLEPFENETIIKIGRFKKHSKGGWSQSRYERVAEETVYKIFLKIKHELKNKNISFDDDIRKTKFGAKLAQIHIFNSKPKIERILKNISFYPAKVKIWSPKKRITTHTPILGGDIEIAEPIKTNKLILGIDPGMETGICLLNLEGKIIEIFSKKNLSRGELIDIIVKIGVPIVVCTDVNPAPAFAKKMAAIYKSKLSIPNKLLSQIDKKKIIQDSVWEKKLNSHQRDALAAAIYAYKKYKKIFDKIDNLDEINAKNKQYSKFLAVQGFSIAEIIKICQQLDDKENKYEIVFDNNYNSNVKIIPKKIRSIEKKLNDKIAYYSAELERNAEIIKEQKIQIKAFTNKKSEIELLQTGKYLKDELIKTKDAEIRKHINYRKKKDALILQMKSRIDELEKMLWMSMEEGGIPIKVIKIFSITAIYNLIKEKGIFEDDILFISDPTGGGVQTVKLLINKKLKCIFFQKNNFAPNIQKIFDNSMIPYIKADKYDIRKLGSIAIISKNNLDLALSDFNQIKIKRQNLENTYKITNAIKNYMYERQKELDEIVEDYDDYLLSEDD